MLDEKDMDMFDGHVQDLTNSFAGKSVDFIEKLKGVLDSEEIASLLIASSVNFFMKTMIVAGFTKEELHHIVDTLYETIKANDIHAQLADAMRQSRKETKQ